MKLSVVLSIYNRKEMFRRALPSIAAQSMPKDDFEIILVDDGSEVEYDDLFREFNTIRFRHIKYDHKLHPIFQELNPL